MMRSHNTSTVVSLFSIEINFILPISIYMIDVGPLPFCHSGDIIKSLSHHCGPCERYPFSPRDRGPRRTTFRYCS
ncbi:uncharacterized protein BJX67DRAFT_357162 [Aspergillus lucknowensis]|uniref:Actin n=1 Tax=Aspergillus lucknowensis TaxID=176173 RepID=A0ABR4LMJ3_9EURO